MGFATGDTLKFAGDGSATLAAPASGGAIDMTSSSAGEYVRLKSGTKLGVLISGFTSGDSVDFEAVPFAETDKIAYANGFVSVENGVGATIGKFFVVGTYTKANFHLGADPAGDVLVSYAATPASACRPAGGGSPADILGPYDCSSPSIPEAQRLLCSIPAASVSSAGTDPGGFGFHSDGTIDGERAALSIGVGWNGPIGGHGPGSGS